MSSITIDSRRTTYLRWQDCSLLLNSSVNYLHYTPHYWDTSQTIRTTWIWVLWNTTTLSYFVLLDTTNQATRLIDSSYTRLITSGVSNWFRWTTWSEWMYSCTRSLNYCCRTSSSLLIWSWERRMNEYSISCLHSLKNTCSSRQLIKRFCRINRLTSNGLNLVFNSSLLLESNREKTSSINQLSCILSVSMAVWNYWAHFLKSTNK